MRSLIVTLILLFSTYSHAFETTGILLAQDSYDAYDPFADYSEFEEASEEEADIHFFKNGRFFTLALFGGYRSFTGTYNQLYSPSGNFGVSLSYFFDLKFAFQISYTTGSHDLNLILKNGDPYSGTLKVQGTGFDIKYYMNTQNVTKGLATFNPYLGLGISQLSRTQTLSTQTSDTAKENSMAFQATAGFEIPMMRNKMYVGAEAQYQYVGFQDEGSLLVVNDINQGIERNGDLYRVNFIVGFNF